MSKAEKRYFKMVSDLQGGDKNYLTLFDLLEESTILDDGLNLKIKTKLNSRFEPARKYLFKVLLRSLRQFEKDQDVESKLTNLLHDSRILYRKGLIGPCLDNLEKTKALALQSENFLYYVMAARAELEYAERFQFEGMSEYALIEKQNKIRGLLDHESKISQHALLYDILLLRYGKNGISRDHASITRLNDLVLEEHHLLNDAGYKSFSSDRLHLHFQSIYLRMTGDLDASLEVYYDLNNLFEEHKDLWQERPSDYFQLLDGILNDLRCIGRYNDMDFFIQKMQGLASNPGVSSAILRYRALEYQLNAAVDQHHVQEAHRLLREHLAEIGNALPQLPVQNNAAFIFAMVRIYFCNTQYSAALKLINGVLNTRTINHSLRVLFELMNLQVNAVLKNRDYLVHATRAVTRKLTKERKLHEAENLMLSLIKAWVAYKPTVGYAEKLLCLRQHPVEGQLIKELCVTHWLTILPK